ncbi:serine hydrolase [Chitinophaga rhizophila]|uniref:Serine hydrolase n=1 Tax=Chitinophaga rhizophila TaxID=2866212 RepID=A0ABS7GHI9_9BACT|nr:serine hydrolase [Chitinophaga rhizophila]MBW8687162.1 serine hydrolase [Chitinophaga rhizophila]
MSIPAPKGICLYLLFMLFSIPVFAHNGSIAYAYPMKTIKIDGDLADWPSTAVRYNIALSPSDTKPRNDADYSGFFQLGYDLASQSLYMAFTITDDDFMQDSSQAVRWNTQDGLELSIDTRHLMKGSGVASFLYTQHLKNISKSFYDPVASAATWDMMEVAMVQRGSTRYYEWRIRLGNELQVGKTIGVDVYVFDMDRDSSFSWSGWGKGINKYANAASLGDVIFLPAQAKMADISGRLKWNGTEQQRIPGLVRLQSKTRPGCWLTTAVDSLGKYQVALPEGTYELSLPDTFFSNNDQRYSATQQSPVMVKARSGKQTTAPDLTLAYAPMPDLIGDKGLLLADFTPASATAVDNFIETYRQYYGIPGVSLALIKDGKLIYHHTYGVSNAMTGEQVNDNTLFEAASVTKPVFAFAVERLAERGIINLDKPLYEYLPYKDIAHDERYKLITARHVLTHRTGFPNWRWMNPDGKLNLRFTPGTAFNYSGEGFEYLKLVVEKITGKQVEQVLQEEVIAPIGLYHTFFSRNDSLQRVVAYGHLDKLPNKNDLPEAPGMAWSMHTEAKIFTRFMLYLLEEKGLSHAMYDTIFSRHSEYNFDEHPKKPTVPTYMGMSLQIRETPFGKTFGHGGNNGDFKCIFEMYKDLKSGYVVFTNSNTSDDLLENLRKFLVEGKQAAPPTAMH